MDPDQTSPIGAVCSGFTLFASILYLSVMLGNYLQQTTSADDIFRCIFFLGALRDKHIKRATIAGGPAVARDSTPAGMPFKWRFAGGPIVARRIGCWLDSAFKRQSQF